MLLVNGIIVFLWVVNENKVWVIGHTLATIRISLDGAELQGNTSYLTQVPAAVKDVGKLEELVLTQQAMIQQLMEGIRNVTESVGTNYIIWGRTVCPSTAQILYDGIAAKSFRKHAGGGVNYLCLHKEPQWPEGVSGGFQSGGYIHGVEYEAGALFNLLNHNAPCALCIVRGRSQRIMIPGRQTCDAGWTKEYSGFLMAEHYSNTKSNYVCVDEQPESGFGGHENKDGAGFYSAEVSCLTLPCPPYVDGYELSCVVCTQ